MKIRIAKKILLAEHWTRRWEAMRPTYRDEERGIWVSPSWHDIPDPQFQKARKRVWSYYVRANKYGHGNND